MYDPINNDISFIINNDYSKKSQILFRFLSINASKMELIDVYNEKERYLVKIKANFENLNFIFFCSECLGYSYDNIDVGYTIFDDKIFAVNNDYIVPQYNSGNALTISDYKRNVNKPRRIDIYRVIIQVFNSICDKNKNDNFNNIPNWKKEKLLYDEIFNYLQLNKLLIKKRTNLKMMLILILRDSHLKI